MLFILALELEFENEFEGSTGCVSNMSHKTHYFAPHWETWTPHSSHNSKVIYVSIQRHPNAVQFLWVVVNTNSVSADSMKGGLGRPLQTKNLGNWKCFKKQDHREERKGKKKYMANNWKVREIRREDLVCEQFWRLCLPQGCWGWVRMKHRWVLAQVKL